MDAFLDWRRELYYVRDRTVQFGANIADTKDIASDIDRSDDVHFWRGNPRLCWFRMKNLRSHEDR
jgi:hypothetical protein